MYSGNTEGRRSTIRRSIDQSQDSLQILGLIRAGEKYVYGWGRDYTDPCCSVVSRCQTVMRRVTVFSLWSGTTRLAAAHVYPTLIVLVFPCSMCVCTKCLCSTRYFTRLLRGSSACIHVCTSMLMYFPLPDRSLVVRRGRARRHVAVQLIVLLKRYEAPQNTLDSTQLSSQLWHS